MDQSLAWLTQKTEEPKSNKGKPTFPSHSKYDLTVNPVSIPPFLHQLPPTGLSPLCSKKFCTHLVAPPPLIWGSWGGGGEVPTMMNPNDVMVLVLKDIISCLLGFRFIYIVYISCHYTTSYISEVLLPPTCLSFGLPVSLVCLSVRCFRSQGKYRATLEFKSSGYAVSNNLIYDSSLSLSVSVKVIPKSFDTS